MEEFKHLHKPDRMIYPIFDKKLNTVVLPYEKRLLLIKKESVQKEVEYLDSLPRNRMRIRVKDISEWKKGDTITIEGAGITYTCVVKTISGNKIVIKNVDESEVKQ